MSLSSMANKKMPKRVNSRQQALKERRLGNRRRKAFFALNKQNGQLNQTQQKKEPTIIILYER